MRKAVWTLSLFVFSASAFDARAVEMGTHFTYQGRLIKNGAVIGDPAPVICDMTFALWDAFSAGNQVGMSPIGPLTISVEQGLFNVNLSFGPDAFNGLARWLEITVQCPGDSSATILAPRQQLRPAPGALSLPGLYTVQSGFSPSVIGGKHENTITPGVSGATIGGGGASSPDNNRVTDTFGTVSGGCSNRAGNDAGLTSDAQFATVGGGFQNVATSTYSTISGGNTNQALGYAAFVGGGVANTADGGTTSVGGGFFNYAEGQSNFIGGGQNNLAIEGNGITVTGGFNNEANGEYSTIGGGSSNQATGTGSTISGGSDNNATGQSTTISGGSGNGAIGSFSSVSGGQYNTAGGGFSTIPGGSSNQSGGDYSFAAGQRAKVRDAAAAGDADGDEGTFVWADSTGSDFVSDGPNRFLVRASGGTKIYSNGAATVGVQLASGGNSWGMLSDKNAKENFKSIDASEMLRRVAVLPVTFWNLKSQSTDVKHIGPMAQDFHAAFGLGESDTHINSSDIDGVTLAAIQGLHLVMQEKDCEIAELKSEVSDLKALVNTLIENAQGGSR